MIGGYPLGWYPLGYHFDLVIYITPSPVSALGETISPTVIYGSLSIIVFVVAIGSVADPTIGMSSLSIISYPVDGVAVWSIRRPY